MMMIVSISLCCASCKNEKLTIIAPYGSPSYATVYLDDYDISVVQGADPLVAAFGAKNYDVIIAPTNLGAKFYNASPEYQLAASIVWGNLFLISQRSIDIESLDHIDLYTFGYNQTPDIVLNYITG